MSTLEVNKITPQGTATEITLGDSGDTFTIPSGVTITNNGTQTGFGGENTPAFRVYRDSTQTITDNTFTKVQFNGVGFDTNSGFDTATNYRYTIPSGQGGSYFFYGQWFFSTTTNRPYVTRGRIYKNGSAVQDFAIGFASSFESLDAFSNPVSFLDNNASAGDYYEIFAYQNNSSNTSNNIFGDASGLFTYFGGFKLIT